MVVFVHFFFHFIAAFILTTPITTTHHNYSYNPTPKIAPSQEGERRGKSVTLSLGHFTTKKYLFGVIYYGTAISGTILGMHRTVRCYDSLF